MKKSEKQQNSELYDFLTATNVRCYEIEDSLYECYLFNKNNVLIYKMNSEPYDFIKVIDRYNKEVRDNMIKNWYKNSEPKDLSGTQVIVTIDGKDYQATIN